MLSTLASNGNIFICSAGHVSPEAHQERKKRPKVCSKDSCEESAEQVSYAAARLLFRRGWIASERWEKSRAQKIAVHIRMAVAEDPNYVMSEEDLRVADKIPAPSYDYSL